MSEDHNLPARDAASPLQAELQPIATWVRLLPIVLFVSYLNFTVILFAFGPWPWPVTNPWPTFGFLLLSHLSLLVGYLSGAFGAPSHRRFRWSVGQLLRVSVLANLVVLPLTSEARTGSYLPDVFGGLFHLGDAYFLSQVHRSASNPVEHLRVILGPLLCLCLPLSIYYWGELDRRQRIASTVVNLWFVGIYVAAGTTKAFADFAALAILLTAARLVAGRWRPNRTQLFAALGGAGCLVLGVLAFFTACQRARAPEKQRGMFALNKVLPDSSGRNTAHGRGPDCPQTITVIKADHHNVFVRCLPSPMDSGAIALSAYLTQGYYGLSLAMDLPFEPCYGVGHSDFILRNAMRVGVQGLQGTPYPLRVERAAHWDAYVRWISIYPWIASDVSFVGCLLIVGLIGRMLALSWVDALDGSNPFAIVVFSFGAIILFYFPANNQVFQIGETVMAFYASLTLWLYTRSFGVLAKSE